MSGGIHAYALVLFKCTEISKIIHIQNGLESNERINSLLILVDVEFLKRIQEFVIQEELQSDQNRVNNMQVLVDQGLINISKNQSIRGLMNF